MNFSNFLNILFDKTNRDTTNKKLFVIELFNSTGIKFLGGEDKAGKLISEGPTRRPVDKTLREDYKDKYDINNVKSFLLKVIDKIQLYALLEEFNIPRDEKKDFDILIEAIAYQFDNYIKYDEKTLNTSVSSIYITLLDEYGNGSNPTANRDAIFAAKRIFYSAIQNIAKLNPDADLLNLKGPFENFFKGCQDAFKIFLSKCNKEGKALYKQVKKDVIDLQTPELIGTKEADNFLELITETGSLPLEIKKELTYIIYDNYTHEDKTTTLTFKIFDDFSKNNIIEALSNIEFHETNEMYFTEYISFKLEGEQNNLLSDIVYIISKIEIILNYLESHFDKHPKSDLLNKKFEELYKDMKVNSLRYLVDGTFYPKEKSFEYHASIEPMLCGDNEIYTPGEHKFIFEELPIFNKFPKDNLGRFIGLFILHFNRLKSFKEKDMMVEILTLNDDKTCRYYMFPPTCKAKIFRKVREIANLVSEDKMNGFMHFGISILYDSKDAEKLAKLKTQERANYGKECLLGHAYLNGKIYVLKKDFDDDSEDISFSEYNLKSIPPFLYPLVKNIIIFQSINMSNKTTKTPD